MSEPTRPIRPELLAAKMEKIENFEQPRLLDEFVQNPKLVRALWFLQWVSQPSNYAGGLTKFSGDLIDASGDLIGTKRMMSLIKAPGIGRYSLKDAVEIFRELPDIERDKLFECNAAIFEEAFLFGRHEKRTGIGECRKDWEPQFLAAFHPAELRSRLREVAKDDLADYFKQLCEMPHVGLLPCDQGYGEGAPWYFVKIAEALLAFIDARAQRLQSRVAETEITKEINRWIAKSRSMQRSIMFIGNSRFGKTEAIKLEASANPGSCRLVNTPVSNAISDLLREVAKSLGLKVGPSNAGRELRERIDYVLRFSHLQLIFDESQFLLPANYSRNTAPARLNWVRRSIMDQDVVAIFVCTPQSYLPAKHRFVKTTGFPMEQFDERVLKRELPDELGEADLFAVAGVHFGDLDENYLRYVVDTVLATERNFVSDIEKIATLAKDNAREHGRKRPILRDIEAAIADVLPTAVETVARAQQKRLKPSVLGACKSAAEALPMPCRSHLLTIGKLGDSA